MTAKLEVGNDGGCGLAVGADSTCNCGYCLSLLLPQPTAVIAL